MDYVKPEVTDFGDLIEITEAGALGGTEDASGKFLQAGVGGVVGLSVSILP